MHKHADPVQGEESGRWLVLDNAAFDATTLTVDAFRTRILPVIIGAVWFSNLPFKQLWRDVHQGFARHIGGWNRGRLPPNLQNEADFVKLVRDLVRLRDTLRPLVYIRRPTALAGSFAKPPLRPLPPHVVVHCFEFLVFPVASKPWIKA